MQTATSIKLPVFATVGQSWASVARHIGLLLRLGWPWLAVFAACLLSIAIGVIVNNGLATPSPQLVGGASVVPLIAMAIAFLLAAPTMAIGWQRGIMLGERPSSPIRIDGRVWAYLGYSVLLVLLVSFINLVVLGLAFVVAGILAGVGDGPMSLERLMALTPFLPIALIPTLVVLNRFVLVLPARALGRDLSFTDALRITRGNTLRLFAISVLVYLPVPVFDGIGSIILLPLQSTAANIAVKVLGSLVSIAIFFASLSYMSLSLKRLLDADEMPAI